MVYFKLMKFGYSDFMQTNGLAIILVWNRPQDYSAEKSC